MNDTTQDNRTVEVERGQAMIRLLNSDDFKLVFEKHYLEDWALTQVQNVSIYDNASRGPVMEQMLARSIFSVFCSDVVAQGNISKEDLDSELEVIS